MLHFALPVMPQSVFFNSSRGHNTRVTQSRNIPILIVLIIIMSPLLFFPPTKVTTHTVLSIFTGVRRLEIYSHGTRQAISVRLSPPQYIWVGDLFPGALAL